MSLLRKEWNEFGIRRDTHDIWERIFTRVLFNVRRGAHLDHLRGVQRLGDVQERVYERRVRLSWTEPDLSVFRVPISHMTNLRREWNELGIRFGTWDIRSPISLLSSILASFMSFTSFSPNMLHLHTLVFLHTYWQHINILATYQHMLRNKRR